MHIFRTAYRPKTQIDTPWKPLSISALRRLTMGFSGCHLQLLPSQTGSIYIILPWVLMFHCIFHYLNKNMSTKSVPWFAPYTDLSQIYHPFFPLQDHLKHKVFVYYFLLLLLVFTFFGRDGIKYFDKIIFCC